MPPSPSRHKSQTDNSSRNSGNSLVCTGKVFVINVNFLTKEGGIGFELLIIKLNVIIFFNARIIFNNLHSDRVLVSLLFSRE